MMSFPDVNYNNWIWKIVRAIMRPIITFINLIIFFNIISLNNKLKVVVWVLAKYESKIIAYN